jgi:predicted outer membrane protein
MIVKSRASLSVMVSVCGLVAVLATASCGALDLSTDAAPAQPVANQGLTPTQWGPLNAADKKLLALVRETSIREITTSQWAEKWSASPLVKQAAQMMITQHVQLQNEDVDVATKLGVTLPDQPSADMLTWMNKLGTERGTTFDADYTNTLRQAHGAALILIATVRADTRNSLMRAFADSAREFVQNHIQMLEKTGIVDYPALPVPSMP